MAQVVALLDELEALLCLDTRRIHATGISNGGVFLYELTLTLILTLTPPLSLTVAVAVTLTLTLTLTQVRARRRRAHRASVRCLPPHHRLAASGL